MDLTNLSQAEKALLAFCGIFVVIFSSVMYYSMIVLPNQTPSQPEASVSAAYNPSIANKSVSDKALTEPRQDAGTGYSANR